MNPEVSIIIEWDNVGLAGTLRAQAMLRRLAEETAACKRPLELLFCYDGEPSDTISSDGLGLPAGARFVGLPGARYYELKNGGAARATGEILVFLDSDVIPEAGWLKALLAPFDDPSVQVVVGHAYIDPESLYSRAFALTWFFPLRAVAGPLTPAEGFFANNAAFRRSTFAVHPFAPIEGTSRGACLELAKELHKAGVTIWKTTAAQVSHPAPRGGRHFALRALAQGRDRVARECGWRATMIGSAARLGRHWVNGVVATLRDRRKVGLTLAGVPVVLGICWTYYALYFVGEAASQLRVPGMSRVRV